jgi:hypothetical protein
LNTTKGVWGQGFAQQPGGVQAVEHRHRQVHEHHVGPEFLGQGHGVDPVTGRADDLEAK